MFANVIVNIASSNVDQLFEYLVPSLEMENYIKVGSRVIVPFGNSNREVMGYVLETYQEKRFEGNTKEIIDLLDLKPVITEWQIKLAFYLKEDTISPLCRILNMMIPSSMQAKTFKYLKITNLQAVDASLASYFNNKNIIAYSNQLNIPLSLIKKEIEKGNVEITYEAKQLTSYRYINKYYVNKELINEVDYLVRNDNVKDFLRSFIGENALTKNEILDQYEISLSQIDNLIKKNLLLKSSVRSFRIKKKDVPTKEYKIKNNELINKIVDVSKPYLIVSKDKDEELELCLGLIDSCLKKNQNAVILTPNILNSIKLASIFRKTFGDTVACLNSNLSNSEFFDYYTNILDDEYKIIVTTPVGAFLPYQNVGLYFMFNEENDNYFNDQSPRYDLHKVLYYLSYNYHILYCLSSLSPSVNSYCYGLKNIYNLIDNSVEGNDKKISCVDLKEELKRGNDTYLSNYLINKMNEVLDNNGQILLLVNNLNSSNFVMCRNCGETYKCPRCQISYSYSEKYNQLVCQSCGKREEFISICPTCKNNRFIFGGIGQERIENELKNRYTSKRILTLSNGKDFNQYLDELNRIEEKEVDIIISTDTIARGSINNQVDLVGLIDFDTVLKTPSFEANSKAYSLLSTASSYLNNKGELIVQTTQLMNSVLTNFITGSYRDFIKEEIQERKLLRLEPFYHINRIIVKSRNGDIFKEAAKIKTIIKDLGGKEVFVLGPVYSKIEGGAVISCKHRSNKINSIYQHLYETYQGSNYLLIFDKYAKKL